MGKRTQMPIVGQRFGRPDLERCDLFIDIGFVDWGLYSGKPILLNESSKKGRQMLSGVPPGGHKKCGVQKQAGYFDSVFSTIFINDPYVEKYKLVGRPPAHPRKGPWVPSHPAQKHSTPGDNYGTFTNKSEYKAFSPLTRPLPRKEKEPINFLTNPGKKGNCGYLDICINKYPKHSIGGKVDVYHASADLCSQNWKAHKAKIRNGPLRSGFYPRYFDENPYRSLTLGPYYVQPKEKVYGTIRGTFYPPAAPKSPGNNHDGCLNKFPEWTPEPYVTAKEAQKLLDKAPKTSGVWKPEPRLKTYYTVSVMNNKIDLACNERTWRTMKPITYPQFNL